MWLALLADHTFPLWLATPPPPSDTVTLHPSGRHHCRRTARAGPGAPNIEHRLREFGRAHPEEAHFVEQALKFRAAVLVAFEKLGGHQRGAGGCTGSRGSKAGASFGGRGDGSIPMTLYCTVCCNPLPETRVVRGSPYCSSECRSAYRKWRRDSLAERRCRLCGRPKRKLRIATEPIARTESAGMPGDTSQVVSVEIRPCAPGAQATP